MYRGSVQVSPSRLTNVCVYCCSHENDINPFTNLIHTGDDWRPVKTTVYTVQRKNHKYARMRLQASTDSCG